MLKFRRPRIMMRPIAGPRPSSKPDRWWHGYGREPQPSDLLDDPIVQVLMSRDQVRREDLEAIARLHSG